MASGEGETMRSEVLGLGNRGTSFCVAGNMEEAVVNGKMMNSISDILGSKKM